MKEEAKILKIVFWSNLLLGLLFVILFETDVLETGVFKDNANVEFIILSVLELTSLGVIPLALYLFKIKRVKNDLYSRRGPALRQWGLVRIDLLSIPMVVNTLLYYLYMNVSFGYLALVLLICMFFIYPTEGRCVDEVTPEE